MCSFEGCDKLRNAYGLCHGHRLQQRKGQELRPLGQKKPPRVCSFEGCDKHARAYGLCPAHRRQQLKGEELQPLRHINRSPTCSFEGCERPTDGRGLCSSHRRQQRKGLEMKPIRQWGQGSLWNGYRYYHRNGKRIVEHRFVMEEILGRPLTADESVHHINGQRSDNRPENLELWSRWQPAGQRVSDKIAWAKEILALYEPTKTPKPKRKPRK